MMNRNPLLRIASIILLTVGCNAGSATGPASTTTGQGGSMARFAITGDRLYTVGERSLTIFDISQPTSPQQKSTFGIGAMIETVFPFEDKLFIGAENGMSVYDISDADHPRFLNKVLHFRSRDPVVTDGKFAYVTLRDTHQLEVLDIRNLDSVTLVRDYYMPDPQGIGIDSGVLFIANGSTGLYQQAIDSTGRLVDEPVTISHYDAYDVIPHQGLLISTGALGITQFDYHDLSYVKELSTISSK
jgi:hypothetical protein